MALPVTVQAATMTVRQYEWQRQKVRMRWWCQGRAARIELPIVLFRTRGDFRGEKEKFTAKLISPPLFLARFFFQRQQGHHVLQMLPSINPDAARPVTDNFSPASPWMMDGWMESDAARGVPPGRSRCAWLAPRRVASRRAARPAATWGAARHHPGPLNNSPPRDLDLARVHRTNKSWGHELAAPAPDFYSLPIFSYSRTPRSTFRGGNRWYPSDIFVIQLNLYIFFK